MLIFNLFLTFYTLLVGISGVHANSLENAESTPIIVGHIKNIQNQTLELAAAVEKWNGDIMDALGISIASDSLLQSIKDGTEAAKESKRMGGGKGLKIKRATKKLLKAIESTLATILRSKGRFEDAGLTSLMISRIEEDKEAAEDLIAAIVDKLRVGKGVGRRLGRKISKAFDSALAEFSKKP